MKIYLAARYEEKKRMQQFRDELVGLGYGVTSTWMDEKESPDTELQDIAFAELEEYANRDLTEIAVADLLVLFTVSETTPLVRAGSIFEAGYAFGLGKEVLVVGPRQNIFFYLPEIPRVKDWKHAKLWLAEARKDYDG